MTISFKDKVAIVTGAGGGLGKAYALELARRGAKVVVNDLGGSRDGTGTSDAAAQVVAEIEAMGGEAIANGASVTEYDQMEKMVADAKQKWGGVHVLINNAGVLRDKTFAKMSLEDFRSVIDVHLMGSVHCTKAVWNSMRDQNYGRIVLTTSSSGLYGNFGQSNYGAAKLALVGLMQTLGLEGAKYNTRVNCLAPSAGTRMLDGLISDEMSKTLTPGSVSPGVVALVGEDAPNRALLCAGGGSYEQAFITMTRGIYVGTDEKAPETIARNWAAIGDRTNETIPEGGMQQSAWEFEKAQRARGGNDPS